VQVLDRVRPLLNKPSRGLGGEGGRGASFRNTATHVTPGRKHTYRSAHVAGVGVTSTRW
jgi:hypothetical protein